MYLMCFSVRTDYSRSEGIGPLRGKSFRVAFFDSQNSSLRSCSRRVGIESLEFLLCYVMYDRKE